MISKISGFTAEETTSHAIIAMQLLIFDWPRQRKEGVSWCYVNNCCIVKYCVFVNVFVSIGRNTKKEPGKPSTKEQNKIKK